MRAEKVPELRLAQSLTRPSSLRDAIRVEQKRVPTTEVEDRGGELGVGENPQERSGLSDRFHPSVGTYQ